MQSAKRRATQYVITLLFILLGGCGSNDTGQVRQSYSLEQIPFPYDLENIGVHPSNAALDDPNNPFRQVDLRVFDKWAQLENLSLNSETRRVARFYYWATLLAQDPNGENQFMTALVLKELMEISLHEGDKENHARLQEQTKAALLAIIDFFPDALGYTAEGASFRLADAARNILDEMGVE